jgi:Golgi nucleoside diphosphatase
MNCAMFQVISTFTFILFLSIWSSIYSIDPFDPNSIDITSPRYVKPTATRGLIIDAGSGGSRLHVFSWRERIFKSVPPPLSYPEANEKWTARISPGLNTFISDVTKISTHLAPLIDFAKVTLVGMETDFADFPIWLKATGGVRELSFADREKIMNEVRRLLSDKSFCPFFFHKDMARVISGEEEAIFSWAATNFLMGTLLPNSAGLGEISNVNHTYGTLDLGGASTQIAFYVPSQDIMEGLYKLQIGGQKAWNCYAKSFLTFGVVSARLRHLTILVDDFYSTITSNNGNVMTNRAINYCFHSGYSEQVHDSTGARTLEVAGPSSSGDQDQLTKCRISIQPLLEKELSKLCDEVFHGDCSIGGAYQPPIPTGDHGHFIGQSTYKYPWAFLQLPKTATLAQFETQAKRLCAMSFAEMMIYYENAHIDFGNDKVTDFLPYYCFLSGYVLTLLEGKNLSCLL